MNKKELSGYYLGFADNYNVRYSGEKKILLLISLARLVVFTGGSGLTILAFMITVAAGISSLIVFSALFLILVKLYSVHCEKRDFFENLVKINRDESAALFHDFSPFGNGNQWAHADHDFSNDVDLFGTGSLFHFLNRTVTGYGNKILSGWLSDPFSLSDKMKIRQAAVKELTAKLKWRQEFIAWGMGKSLEEKDIRGLLEWLNDEQRYFKSTSWRILIFLLPALLIISLLLVIIGVIPYTVSTFLFLVNLTLVASRLRKTSIIHRNLSKRYLFLSSLGRLLSTFEREPFESAVISEIKTKITGDSTSAVQRIKKLSRLIQAFDSRMNLLVGFILNGLLIWDFHCVYKLEKWKSQSKDNLPQWLDLLGTVDAYISLANFSFNNTEFAYPVVSTGGEILITKDLGHPLIPDEKRVCNDFTLLRSGHICIITGANMAGKSTFLRTIAVNFIIGMAGAPVCASEMQFTPLHLFTSMRTTDSLSHNESYFYAELKRLRLLKERLEAGENVLFILDEILKGTNSNDKSAGSKLFMKKIIRLGGTGLIATHDTSLGEMEQEFPDLIANKCFEIEIEGENIYFDYKLQNGITKKMNAGLLMRQMGITE